MRSWYSCSISASSRARSWSKACSASGFFRRIGPSYSGCAKDHERDREADDGGRHRLQRVLGAADQRHAGRVVDVRPRPAHGADRRRQPPLGDDEEVAKAAAASACQVSSSAAAKYAATIYGVAHHETASYQSPWKRPPKSSRLYAQTMKPPTATRTASHGAHTIDAATPIATAPPSALGPSPRSARRGCGS